MPIIVDEMEVDTQPQREQRRGGGESGGGGEQSQQPKPEEIERALRLQVERAERVWAH